jgi:Protein of unknown function (Hypoth_ymh)
MNSQIKSYADSIYEQSLMESIATMNAAKSNYFHQVAVKQSPNLPLGGSQVQGVIKFYAEHIERCMAARLDSYQKAFSEVGLVPTEQDFTEMLNEFKEVQKLQAKHSGPSIINFVRTRGGQIQGDLTESLVGASAHGHDRILRIWKVWREKGRLQRASTTEKKVSIQTAFGTQAIISSLGLLHPEFRNYAHYFHEDKLKEAIAAAFERYENRLNEIRDKSRKPAVRSASGHDLVYKLFADKILRRPYPKLGGTPTKKNAYEQGLTGILSGGVSWIRNAYTHEKHKLPTPTPSEVLELLFVASYFMRMIDLSERQIVVHPTAGKQ